MSHKYQHIKNMQQLDDELHMASIRRELLLNEIRANVDDVKSNFSFGGAIMTAIGSLFSFGAPAAKDNNGTNWENILALATKVGGIIALLRAFTGRKK